MRRHVIGLVVASVILGILLIPETLQAVLGLLFPDEARLIYPRQAPIQLLLDHLGLIAVTSLIAALLGFAAALLALFSRSSSTLRLISITGTTLQTIPPMAVLALMVPIAGFGAQPVLFALVLFGILPVLHYSLSALTIVPPAAIEAGRGLGFSPIQVFFKIQLPLAAPGVLSGIRTSMLINIGTATIGATMGTGGLGRPIIAGLTQFAYPYLLQGALTAAVLAYIVDSLFAISLLRLKRG